MHEFINHETKEWNISSVSTIIPQSVLVDIKAITIPCSPIKDKFLWGFSQDGKFTLKSATWAIRKSLVHPRQKILNWIWKLNSLSKIKVFLWLTIREALQTCNFSNSRRIEITNTCYLCNKSNKNIDHIFKVCPFVHGIWERIKYNCPIPLFYEGNFLSWLELFHKNYKKPIVKFSNQWKKLLLSFGVFGHRNHVVFRKIKPNPFLIIEKATSSLQNLNELMSDDYLTNE